METAAAVPDDALAGVLGLVPPRSLAAARCVCRSWRRVVDDRRLLLPHLLPRSVGGFFLNYYDHEAPHFFARPVAPAEAHPPTAACGTRIDGEFSFVSVGEGPCPEPPYWHTVLGHCDGLVLFAGCGMYLCNPATRWWARLPPHPAGYYSRRAHDPAASPKHWEVLLAPLKPHKEGGGGDNDGDEEEEHGEIFSGDDGARRVMEEEHGEISEELDCGAWRHRRATQEEEHVKISEEVGAMEWPPATWTWHAISPRTMRWEERVFVREGEAAGTVAGLKLHSEDWDADAPWRNSAYCQGALYVRCGGDHVSRLSMATNKYRAIKSPIDLADHEQSIIGKSENGVYLAAIDHKGRLRVWILNESHDDGEMGWQLKHHSVVSKNFKHMRCHGPCWILDDYYETEGKKVAREHCDGWNSDDDNATDIVDNVDVGDGWIAIMFLGFHPYKEVIFLDVEGAAIACHLKSTKIQNLGDLLGPNSYHRGLEESFVYTPCLVGLSAYEKSV